MTPSEHYAAAERLLAKLADMDATLPICRALTMQAHVHALLAAYTPPPESYHSYRFRDGYDGIAIVAQPKDEHL